MPDQIKTIEPNLLSFHLLKPCENVNNELLIEAYRCWHDTWNVAFAELNSNHEFLHSDDFMRQHEIGAVFQDKECIALSFFRWLDFSLPMSQADSYFKVWPEAARKELCREGTKICVSSNFTIAAGWRRSTKCSLKDVLVSLIIERFKLSNADACTATVRNNRGIDKLIYRNGFSPIQHEVDIHNVKADLGAFYKSNTRIVTNDTNEAIIQALKPKDVK